MRAKLKEMGEPWGALTEPRKFGNAFQRKSVLRKFRSDELVALPEKHQARLNPDLMVTRQDFVEVALPLRWTCVNPVEVIFDGADAVTDAVRPHDPEV